MIGAIARREEAAGVEVVIVSSDKDMMQLVTDRVSMLNPAKDDEWYDPAKVKEFLGVEPAQVADLLALKGDAVDNIPGAPGIGEKGARDLIARFGSVEAAIAHAAEVQRKAYRESLQNNVERIRMSKRLATIETDVPIDFSLESAATQVPDPALLKAVYKEMEFHSLLKELGPAKTRGLTITRRSGMRTECARGWPQVPRGAPVAWPSRRSGEGELALDTIGLAVEAGRSARGGGGLDRRTQAVAGRCRARPRSPAT